MMAGDLKNVYINQIKKQIHHLEKISNSVFFSSPYSFIKCKTIRVVDKNTFIFLKNHSTAVP